LVCFEQGTTFLIGVFQYCFITIKDLHTVVPKVSKANGQKAMPKASEAYEKGSPKENKANGQKAMRSKRSESNAEGERSKSERQRTVIKPQAV